MVCNVATGPVVNRVKLRPRGCDFDSSRERIRPRPLARRYKRPRGDRSPGGGLPFTTVRTLDPLRSKKSAKKLLILQNPTLSAAPGACRWVWPACISIIKSALRARAGGPPRTPLAPSSSSPQASYTTTMRALRVLGTALLLTSYAVSSSVGSTVLAAERTTERATDAPDDYDVLVYGATSGGVMAAVSAARNGAARVALLDPGDRIGGMTAGGLSATDVGNSRVIGGMALGLYRENGRRYGKAVPEFNWEPHVALELLHQLIVEAKVPLDSSSLATHFLLHMQT